VEHALVLAIGPTHHLLLDGTCGDVLAAGSYTLLLPPP
jgi:hypothetical protein